MKALIGRKLGMTQLFDDEGAVQRVTVIEATPNIVTQVKTRDRDGYNAVQLGAGSAKKPNRPLMGHLKASNSSPSVLKEIRLPDIQASNTSAESEAEAADLQLKVGTQVDVTAFAAGDKIQVSSIAKGKGFAGTIKRHNFSRGPKTHGSHNYRGPGSIGAGFPQHVMKGMRMAGRMGGGQVTTKNLTVILVDPERNLLAVRGAVPGARRSTVVMRGRDD